MRTSARELFAEVLRAGMKRRARPEGVEDFSRHEEILCEFERVHEAAIALPQREAPSKRIHTHTYILIRQGRRGGLTYVANWLVNQRIENGRRWKMCEAGGPLLAGGAGTLSPAP